MPEELTVEALKRKLDTSERKRSILQKKLTSRYTDDDGFAWSIADLMTLLLIFFILFYAHAASQMRTAQESAPEKSSRLPTQTLFFWRQPLLTSPDKPVRPEDQVDKSLENMRREVMEEVNSQGEKISARLDNKQLVFVLGERFIFEAGEANLLGESRPTLERIARVVTARDGYRVTVAGHTDDSPIHTPRFPSNWELSAARAVNVARLLIEYGVDPKHISVMGFADTRPLTDNQSPESRQANRRVEITLHKDIAGQGS